MMIMKSGSIILTFLILDILCTHEYAHAFQCKPINSLHRTTALIDHNLRLNIISRPSYYHQNRNHHHHHILQSHSIQKAYFRCMPCWVTRSLRSTMSGVMSVIAIIFTFSRRAVAASSSVGAIIGKYCLFYIHSFLLLMFIHGRLIRILLLLLSLLLLLLLLQALLFRLFGYAFIIVYTLSKSESAYSNPIFYNSSMIISYTAVYIYIICI